MSMIEVDPKLFVKCRLCLDETGQYQIVPKVQMQIKYCFDIDVEPFDGLPQLVCKKCESILSQYAGIKQIFQEKQSNLKSRINADVHSDNNEQQQQDTVTSTQTEVENQISLNEDKKLTRQESVCSSRSSSTEKDSNKVKDQNVKSKSTRKNNIKIWQDVSYEMCFVCRFCANTLKSKKSVLKHVRDNCNIYKKYSNVLKSYCSVELGKIGSKPNLTGSKDNVVHNKNKIINSNYDNYYVLYSLKESKRHVSDSSDEDNIVDSKKRKRQRLLSRSSDETAIIEENTVKSIASDDEEPFRKTDYIENTDNISDIECVNLDDSDNASTKSSSRARDVDLELVKNCNIVNDKMINNIITMCSTKYINRFIGSKGGKMSKEKEESSLKHKILSIGRKIIHNKGINCTGLLRYMEHKDLEVVWIPMLDSNVIIRTRPRESTDSENNNFGWENITSLASYNPKTRDFIDIFEKLTELDGNLKKKDKNIDNNKKNPREKLSDKKTENDILYSNNSKTPVMGVIENNINNNPESSSSGLLHLTKLLNANPVANPKQLPKKVNPLEIASIIKTTTTVPESETQLNNEELLLSDKNKDLHLPIITSTVSLASTEPENVKGSNLTPNEVDTAVAKTPALPKIKVKPVTELMSEHALSQQSNTRNTFVSSNNWTVDNQNSVISNPSQTVVVQNNSGNVVYMTNTPVYTNVMPVPQKVFYYPQFETGATGIGIKDKGGMSEFNPNVSTVPVVLPSGSNPESNPGIREYVKLHTVELPNTRTDSPYQYFQKLLQIHNIHLLSSTSIVSTAMICLSKFKVVFEQETNAPVKLSLFLFCNRNVFCIKAKDHVMKDLDIAKFSANWQWEILKVFKGDVVPKLNQNAKKLGTEVFDATVYFVSLLKSIVFSKDI